MSEKRDPEKKTVELPKPVPPQERPTVEMATLPVILGEVRELRKEGAARGERTQKQITDLAMQVQTNYEQQGGKIRSLEGRTEAVEGRTASVENRLSEVEKKADSIEKDAKDLKGQIAELRGDTTKQVSLTEEQMAKKLEAESAERLHVDISTSAKVDMLQNMLVQSFGLHLPKPNPDGSLPPPGDPKKQPKNIIQKQTFWTRIAAIMGGIVIVAGALDKMGVFEALRRIIWGP